MANRSIIDVLQSKPNGDRLLFYLEGIKECASPILARIIETFPEYTSHGIQHSEAIIERLNSIIPDPLKEEFNEYEIYFLIASAYLHDIGMANIPELGGVCKFESREDVQSYIRSNHHLRAEDFIKRNYNCLRIQDEHQARFIGRICRGHRECNLFDKGLFSPDQFYGSKQINVPLLASLLRIGDELDLTSERTPQIIYEHMPPKNEISKSEWEKHLSVSGGGPLLENPLFITYTAVCKNPDIHRALKKLEVKINNELKDLPHLLYQYKNHYKDIPREFVITIQPEGYKVHDVKFTLHESTLINLLMGEKLYRTSDESIRELIKNSVDSCRSRKRAVEGYIPCITIQLAADRSTLKIIDNGDGMDEYIIDNYFSKIGQSFYQSQEFLEKGAEFSPLSELGIGVLSYFLIAKKIVVETKAENCPSNVIEIDDIGDYFFVREGQKSDVGTSVTLFLKDDAKNIDFLSTISHYARHLKIPLNYISECGEIARIHGIDKTSEINEHVREYYGDVNQFKFFKIESEFVSGLIGFLFKQDKELNISYPSQFPLRYDSTHNGEEIPLFHNSYEGIFINNHCILSGWIDTKQHYWKPICPVCYDLDFKRKVIDLNVARNEIVQNEKILALNAHLDELITSTLHKYFSEMKKKIVKKAIAVKSLRYFFQIFIDWNNVYEKDMIATILPLFKEYYYYLAISKDGLGYLDYKSILDMEKPICVLKSLPNSKYDEIPNTRELYYLFSKCSGFSDNTVYLLRESRAFGYKHDGFNLMLKSLFAEYDEKLFLSFFDRKKQLGLVDILPSSWEVWAFNNFASERFIEYMQNTRTILNAKNRFVSLLLENCNKLDSHQKMILSGFFSTLKKEIKGENGLMRVQIKQRQVLDDIFFKNGFAAKKDMESYLLKEDDFSSIL